jgi:hypothetical protein
MALVRNYRSQFQNPGTYAGQFPSTVGNTIKGGLKNRFVGPISTKFGAVPSGSYYPQSFIGPWSIGAASSFTSLEMVFTTTATGLSVRLGEGTSNFVFTTLGNGVTLAQGSGNASFIFTTSAQGNGIVETTGTANFNLTTTANGSALVQGNGTAVFVFSTNGISSSIVRGEGSWGGAQPLSPEGLAQAVWDYLRTNPTAPNSMKEILESLDTAPILTAIQDLNDISQSEVLTQIQDALTSYDGPTKAELDLAETNIISEIQNIDVDLAPVLIAINSRESEADAALRQTQILNALANINVDLTPVLDAIALTATSVELEAAKDEILNATVAIDIPAIVAAVRLDLERIGGPIALVKIDTTQIISNISALNDLSALDVYNEVINGITASNLVNDADLLVLQNILLDAIANKVLIRKDEIIGTVNSGGSITGEVQGPKKITGIVTDQNNIGV